MIRPTIQRPNIFDHLKTRLAQYSDSYCIIIFAVHDCTLLEHNDIMPLLFNFECCLDLASAKPFPTNEETFRLNDLFYVNPMPPKGEY